MSISRKTIRNLQIAGCVLVCMFVCACGNSGSEKKAVETLVSEQDIVEQDTVDPNTAYQNRYQDQAREYMDLVEDHLGGRFSDMEYIELEELAALFQGHYDIIGRKDESGRAYMLALRREDAPVYEDMKHADIATVYEANDSEYLQIGYYDKEDESRLLYKLSGYELREIPVSEEPLSVFCVSEAAKEDALWSAQDLMAFSDTGRKWLDFMNGHPGLALREGDESGIEFYYQDGDTISYWSEPYRCFLPVTDEEQTEFERLLTESDREKEALTYGEAREQMRKAGLYSTGVYVYMPEHVYQLFGNHENPVFLELPKNEEYPSVSKQPVAIIQGGEAWEQIIGRLDRVMQADYGSFDGSWFERPLERAVLHFPEMIREDGTIQGIEKRVQTIEDPQKLEKLSKLLEGAIQCGEVFGFSACPYNGELILTREDGDVQRIYIATDSCDSMAWDGRISFEYGGQKELAEIFDEAMRGRKEEPDRRFEAQPTELPVLLQNLSAGKKLLSQTYYQAGNVSSHLDFYEYLGEDGDKFLTRCLGISVTKEDSHYSEPAKDGEFAISADGYVETFPGQNTYQTELTVTGYRNWEPVFEDTYNVMISLPKEGDMDESVSLQFDDSADVPDEIRSLSVSYYPMGQDEDLFTRYLCWADLCSYPTEVLRLMRNTIYAAHGRAFKDPLLAEYMAGKPWYRQTVESEAFSEDVLSDVEKKNIALLKELEKIPADQRVMLYGEDYSIENFDFAPYLSLLSQNAETGLHADFTQAKDCGSYYRVPGELYLPVTLTRQQWKNVQSGEKEEVCVNELTGEVKILELDNRENYWLYTKGMEPDRTLSSDIYVWYESDTGFYQIQQASDDTIMKLVYEGDLYFLKGSVWGGMVSLRTASEIQEEITTQTQEVYANCLYHNGRGYFTAVYALGD